MIPTQEQWQELARRPSGDLGETSYALLLAALARAKRSLEIRLDRPPVAKQIGVVEGVPTSCRSNLAHETFGRFLLSAGVIGQEDFNAALSDSLKREVPLGEILIERGLMTPQGVYNRLQQSLGRRLLDGFGWNRGQYDLVETKAGAEGVVRVNVARLILTGVLKLTPRAEILAVREELDAARFAPGTESLLAGKPLPEGSGWETVSGALTSGPASGAELVRVLSGTTGERYRRLYGLVLVGLLETVGADAAATRVSPAPESPERDRPERDRPGPEPAPAAEPPDEDLLLRQSKIVEAFLSFKRRDSFEFLGLEEGATPNEIENAYLEAARTYAPWALERGGAADFVEQARLLILHSARAYAELAVSETRNALIHRRKVLRDERAKRRQAEFKIETDLLDSEAQFRKGRALVEAGEPGKALEFLAFAADCDPQNALYRAELAFQRDRFDPPRHRSQAIGDLEEAVRIDPGCGLAHYYLGQVLAAAGDRELAEASLRRSVKLMAPDRRPIDALRALSSKKR